jgi:hypothetical protein
MQPDAQRFDFIVVWQSSVGLADDTKQLVSSHETTAVLVDTGEYF